MQYELQTHPAMHAIDPALIMKQPTLTKALHLCQTLSGKEDAKFYGEGGIGNRRVDDLVLGDEAEVGVGRLEVAFGHQGVKRLAAGLTVKELAARLSVTVQFIRQWENGNGWPGPRLIPQLAKLFRMDAEDFARELEEARCAAA